MGRNQRLPEPHAGPVCPACGQPVGEEITRYKTMGVVIPEWKPAPCHNPQCPEGLPEEEGPGDHEAQPVPLECLHRLRSGG